MGDLWCHRLGFPAPPPFSGLSRCSQISARTQSRTHTWSHTGTANCWCRVVLRGNVAPIHPYPPPPFSGLSRCSQISARTQSRTHAWSHAGTANYWCHWGAAWQLCSHPPVSIAPIFWSRPPFSGLSRDVSQDPYVVSCGTSKLLVPLGCCVATLLRSQWWATPRFSVTRCRPCTTAQPRDNAKSLQHAAASAAAGPLVAADQPEATAAGPFPFFPLSGWNTAYHAVCQDHKSQLSRPFSLALDTVWTALGQPPGGWMAGVGGIKHLQVPMQAAPRSAQTFINSNMLD